MCQIDTDRDLMLRGCEGKVCKLILVENKGKRKYRKARQQGGKKNGLRKMNCLFVAEKSEAGKLKSIVG